MARVRIPLQFLRNFTKTIKGPYILENQDEDQNVTITSVQNSVTTLANRVTTAETDIAALEASAITSYSMNVTNISLNNTNAYWTSASNSKCIYTITKVLSTKLLVDGVVTFNYTISNYPTPANDGITVSLLFTGTLGYYNFDYAVLTFNNMLFGTGTANNTGVVFDTGGPNSIEIYLPVTLLGNGSATGEIGFKILFKP